MLDAKYRYTHGLLDGVGIVCGGNAVEPHTCIIVEWRQRRQCKNMIGFI